MALSVVEFETRLKSGRYTTQGDARRAAFKLLLSERARTAVLEGISRHFGEGYTSVSRPETSTGAPSAAPGARSIAPTLGDVARAKKTNSKAWRESKKHASVAGRAGGLARAQKLREARAELERYRTDAQMALAEMPPGPPSKIPTGLHVVPPAAPPTLSALPPVPPSAPAAPVVSLADMRSETDRVVRELAARMPPAVAPVPDGVEHAYKLIADSARELFESLVSAVKGEERLRPDMLRAGHSMAMLVETGNDVLLSKLTAPAPKAPEAPKSDRTMSEAAE